MRHVPRQTLLILLLLVLPSALAGMAAAEVPEYSITYTVTVGEDGSALWHVEYRTLLLTSADMADFESYAADLPEVYLPEFRELMERSAAQAAAATGRTMEISDVTGTAVIQESPTGRFGVVVYTALWDGFARVADTIVIGDAFTGGLYLEKDNMLVIRIPGDYTLAEAVPEPDSTRDGLVWYGPRSFGAGEPRVVLEEQVATPPAAILGLALAVVIVIVIAGYIFFRRTGKAPDGPPDPAPPSGAGLMSLDEQILQLLATHGGELYQSEIVRTAGLPRSTVSTVLNDLHARGAIVKVKKGRENLIRLSGSVPPDE